MADLELTVRNELGFFMRCGEVQHFDQLLVFCGLGEMRIKSRFFGALLIQMMFAGNLTFLKANLYLFPAITAYAAVAVLVASFCMLALSSLSKSRRFVAVMYAGLIFFTAAMYQALRGITGSQAWLFISPGDVLDVIADRIFRSAGESATQFWVALLVVALLLGGSLFVLERRVRGVEVVT